MTFYAPIDGMSHPSYLGHMWGLVTEPMQPQWSGMVGHCSATDCGLPYSAYICGSLISLISRIWNCSRNEFNENFGTVCEINSTKILTPESL